MFVFRLTVTRDVLTTWPAMFPVPTGETGVCPWLDTAVEWTGAGRTSSHVLTPTSGPTLSSESSWSQYYLLSSALAKIAKIVYS